MFDRVIRAAWFERDPSPLIEAACPLLLGVRTQSSVRAFLRVHWARGPHLDCVMDADDSDPINEVAGTLAAWIGHHPSITTLPEDFARRSRHMAEAEQWTGALAPFYQNNSVAVFANDRTTLWGSEHLWLAAACFHCDLLPDIADLVIEKRRSRGAFVLAVARRLAAIGRIAGDGEFDFWPLSFSAHARLFLAAHPSMRPTFEDAWRRLRRPAALALGEIVESGDDPADLTVWLTAGAALDARVKAVQADPDVAIVPTEVHNPLHIQDTLGSYAQVSSHLHAMFDTDRLSAVFASPLHHRFRIIVNIAYESLATATITPVERALACYILSRVIIEDFPEVAAEASARVNALAETHHD